MPRLTGTTAQWVSSLAIIAGILVWWIRGAPDRRRAKTESDASLRTDLLHRIEHLEQAVADEREKCEAALFEMRTKYDGLIRQFIGSQIAWVEELPPDDPRRSPSMEAMIRHLRHLGKGLE